MYLRKGKNHYTAVLREKSEKEYERNNPINTTVSEEGRGGGALGTRADIPLQPVVRTMVKLFPCSPWKITVDQVSTLQPMEDPMPEQVDVP